MLCLKNGENAPDCISARVHFKTFFLHRSRTVNSPQFEKLFRGPWSGLYDMLFIYSARHFLHLDLKCQCQILIWLWIVLFQLSRKE